MFVVVRMRPLVIIPALNEERELKILIPRIPKGLDILVIDDGSTDNTAEISLRNTMPTNPSSVRPVALKYVARSLYAL